MLFFLRRQCYAQCKESRRQVCLCSTIRMIGIAGDQSISVLQLCNVLVDKQASAVVQLEAFCGSHFEAKVGVAS